MKPLILTLFLATPTYAGGIAEPHFATDTLPPAKYARMVEQDSGGLFKVPSKQVRPDTPDDPEPVAEKPRMSKQEAVRSWGVGRWKDAPNADVFRDIYRNEGADGDYSRAAKGGE